MRVWASGLEDANATMVNAPLMRRRCGQLIYHDRQNICAPPMGRDAGRDGERSQAAGVLVPIAGPNFAMMWGADPPMVPLHSSDAQTITAPNIS